MSAGSAFAGFVDVISHEPGQGWTIAGWARNLMDPSARYQVRILCHGNQVAEAVADGFREDLVIPGSADGRHAFSILIPDDAAPAAETGSFNVLLLPDRQPLPLAEHLAGTIPSGLRGSIDIVGRDRIAGWLRSDTHPDMRLSVAIMVDDALQHRMLANQFRPDLRDNGLGDGRYGFDVMLSPPLSLDSDHVVSVLCAETNTPLPGSPLYFPATRRFNETFRQHVRQTLNGIATARQREAALEFLADQTHQLRNEQGREDSRKAATEHHRLAQRRKEAEPGVTVPRILFVDDRAPDPTRDAGSSALLSHMQAAQALDYEVSFVASVMEPGVAAVRELEKQGFACWRAPAYPTVESLLRTQTNSFDAIYFHRLTNAGRYLDLARLYMPGARLISSVADLAWLRLERQAVAENRPELRTASGQEKVREHMATWASHSVITHSPVEAALLAAAVPTASIHVVPWHLELKEPPLPFERRHGVAFIAHYGHAPNIDAAKWLVGDILPLLWEQTPDIEILLVGSAMPDLIIQMGEIPGVQVLGHIADLDSFLRSVRLTIAPLRFGAGIKSKVLESWAAGIPCVATPIATEGMNLPVELQLSVASSAADLAKLVAKLYYDPEATASLAEAGQDYIRIRHSTDRVRSALDRSLGTLRRA
ncbi:glycosyltransferase [Acetobacter sp.]|uniref:glycosyltransferase n=1 Tax=Acetobacter sp. TaxID=440 RepID=UPI0025BBF51D|nr:glycosyltransferase [Acetobacter sp.]MCH4090509.1 glycosyltransferase [Acetobacter sp.]MCI1299203.1 glycosyltransferase [Acetobacter sp.]MCI1315750.1 glycosyltransferase [Acetobacter sp.]